MADKPDGHDVVRQILGPLDGARIPGGCDHCDAYQTVRPIEAGVWTISVHHGRHPAPVAPRTIPPDPLTDRRQ